MSKYVFHDNYEGHVGLVRDKLTELGKNLPTYRSYYIYDP